MYERKFPYCLESHLNLLSISSADLARVFNLKAPTSGRFYERLYSLIYYGLLEQKGRGYYSLTETAKQIVSPDTDEQKIRAYKTALLHVPLWKELSTFPNLPEHIWISIKKATNLTTDEALDIENRVREWYIHDHNFVEDLSKGIESERNDYSSDYNTIPNLNTQAIHEQESADLPAVQKDTIVIPFANMEWRYPNNMNTEDAWNQFNDYMEVYLKYEKKGKKDTGKGSTKGQGNASSSESLPGDVEYSIDLD